MVAIEQSDFDRAAHLVEDSLIACQALGDKQAISNALNSVGYLAVLHGEYVRAETLLNESVSLARDLGYRLGEAIALGNLGYNALAQRDIGRADIMFVDSLRSMDGIAQDEWMAWSVAGRAAVVLEQGKPEQAARLSGAIDSLIKATSTPIERTTHERTIAAAHAALGHTLFSAVWDSSSALSIAEVCREALR